MVSCDYVATIVKPISYSATPSNMLYSSTPIPLTIHNIFQWPFAIDLPYTFISESDLAEDGRVTTKRHYAGNGPHVMSGAGFEMKPPLEVRDIVRMVLVCSKVWAWKIL